MRYVRNGLVFPFYGDADLITSRCPATPRRAPRSALPVSAAAAARGGAVSLWHQGLASQPGQVQSKRPRQTYAEISMSSRSQLTYLVTRELTPRHGAPPGRT